MRATAELLTDGLHELRARIWQRYMSAEPPTPDETEIRVRIEGVMRALDFADQLTD